MKDPEGFSSSATLVACSAVSVVLLVSLAVALIEAVAAIKRKFNPPTSAGSPAPNSKEESLCRIGSCVLGHGEKSRRKKKISLPEFTWLRHIRRCQNHGEANNNNSLSHPNIKDSLGKNLPESWKMDPLEENDVCWSPVTQVRQMGAVRFTAAATRRISTPVAPRKLTVTGAALRKLSECPCSQPSMTSVSSRHSTAVANSFASLPLTPGVARLCSSLTDILESHGPNANGDHSSLESESSSASSYRHTASLEPIMASTTALEARLKRVRLIRHR